MNSPGDKSSEQPTISRLRPLTMWSIVPRVMTMPASGWELAIQRGPKPEIAVLRFLLPVSFLAGGAEFLSMIYHSQLGFTEVLVRAVISFCSFFLGYYLSIVFAQLLLPKDARHFPTTNTGKLMTMAGIASLAFFHILFLALPMFDFIIEFFPLWTIFFIFRGFKMMVVSAEKQTFALAVFCIDIICTPLLIDWFFTSLT